MSDLLVALAGMALAGLFEVWASGRGRVRRAED